MRPDRALITAQAAGSHMLQESERSSVTSRSTQESIQEATVPLLAIASTVCHIWPTQAMQNLGQAWLRGRAGELKIIQAQLVPAVRTKMRHVTLT